MPPKESPENHSQETTLKSSYDPEVGNTAARVINSEDAFINKSANDDKYLVDKRPPLSPGFMYVGNSSTITSYPDDTRLEQVKLDKQGRPVLPVGYEYVNETGLEYTLTEAREEREKRGI